MIGILFIARLGSKRLAQKHLIETQGKTFLEWLILRMKNEFTKEILANEVMFILCSSEEPINKTFEKQLNISDLNFFYGHNHHIPQRQLDCALANHLSGIISIDGDDILCSSNAARSVFEALKQGVDICKTQGLPLGMNVMGYQTSVLTQALGRVVQKTLETGWGRIFDGIKMTNIPLGDNEYADKLRMTLDYAQDADFFSMLIHRIGEQIVTIKDEDLIQYILDNEIYRINQGLIEKYWENFNNEKSKEHL